MLTQTPFERVRASAAVDADKVIALEHLFWRMDLFVLAQHFGLPLDRVAGLRSRAPQAAPQRAARWPGWTFSPRAPQARGLSHMNSTHTIG